MPLPKSFTKVTPLSKMLALSMFILIPILSFYYGIYYEQQKHTELPNLFCKHWETVCDPDFVDENRGGCAPKRICADQDSSYYTCPKTAYVNCMPPANSDKPFCQPDYMKWAEKNCPNFKVAW